ncbi:MAG: methyl-accepting chemotaxis protein [Armatimonadetes bacterium]|nr:methyl-accepting chemotaxis protein [Armatimonadota bacterium]
MKIRWKILIGYVIVLFVFAVAAGFQVYQMRQARASYERIVQQEVFKAAEAQKFLLLFQRLPILFQSYILTGNEAEFKDYSNRSAEAVLQLQKLQDLCNSEQEKELIKEIQRKLDDYRSVTGYLTTLKTQAISYEAELKALPATGSNMARRMDLIGQLDTFQKEMSSYLAEKHGVIDAALKAGQDFVSLQEQSLQAAVENNRALVNKIEMVNYLAVGLALLFGLLIAFYIGQLVARPVQMVEGGVSRIAAGDLSVADLKSNSRDEIGSLARSFNQMKQNLREIVQKVAEGARSIFHAASQLSESARQTTQGATSTASAISEIAAAVEDGAGNAGQAAQAAEKAAGLAGEGNAKVERLITQMGSIELSTNQVARAITELGETSREITKIVEMITSIADQTNLLALNAAIEAARAGEQGRGFAVVAEEVRKLAEQSGDAAKDIYQLVQRIQERAAGAIANMEENAQQVQAGNFIVREVGELFAGITETVRELSTQIQEVAATAEQIAGGVQNVAGTAEEQTAAMEEVSAAAESLQRLAAELEEAAARFKI